MGNRYGRKQKRAHRAAMADVQARAVEMSLRYQRLLGTAEEKARAAQETARLIAAGHAGACLRDIVAKAEGEFVQKALTEMAAKGVARMQVYSHKRPAFQKMEYERIVTVVIPETVWNFAIEEPRGVR